MSKDKSNGLQVYKADDDSFISRMKKSDSVQKEAHKKSSTGVHALEKRRKDIAALEVVLSRASALVQSEDPEVDIKQKEKAMKVAQLTLMEIQAKGFGLIVDCLTDRQECWVDKAKTKRGYRRVPLMDIVGSMLYEAFVEGEAEGSNGTVNDRLDQINNHAFLQVMMAYVMQRHEPEMILKDKFGVESPLFPQCEALMQHIERPPEATATQKKAADLVVDENEGVAE